MARARIKAPPSGPPIDGSAGGQLLRWDGLQWVPFGAGSDVGDILQWNGSQYVPGGGNPTVGQTLVWNGSLWVPGSATPSGITQKIWEWNGTDVSQFEGSAAAARFFTSSTLTVVADATLPKGNKLRLTAAPAGGGEVTWLAITPLVFSGAEKNYRIRMEVVGLTEEFAGVAFLCQKDGSGDLFGFSDVSGQATAAGWRNRWDAGTNVDSGATQRGMHASGVGTLNIITLYDFFIRGSKSEGGAPDFWVAGKSATDNNAGTAGRKAWALADALTSGWAAFPAGWNTLNDLNRFGLTIKANVGAPVFDIHALEIWTDGFNVSV